ncbi:cytochrome b N-terminal domain-containing protein [Telmatobacter bradus]|uniref:cytochrome b N-terminal domain-containing protein n=1 Tax=Telmatobacter bradus TaxID=474953 RepID=UPI003B43A19E
MSQRNAGLNLDRLKKSGAEIVHWFETRTGLIQPAEEMANHPTPSSAASWWYVFGSAAMVLLMLQVVTGILLAMVYSPSASNAWASLNFINHDLPLGWFLRAMHGWGSDFMIAIVLIHMVQVFMFGAYKFPRELTWIVGVLLLLLTLGMAFTGQVLRFDQDSYWGLGIGTMITSSVPGVGKYLVKLMLGGPIIGGATLSHFFALHVFIIPGALLGFVGLHLLMVLRLGINEWPMPGRVVRKADYDKNYAELTKKTGVPFVPNAAWKDVVFASCVILAVMFCAFYYGPFGPTGQPDPTIIQTAPKPDFFFLWIYAVLAFLPPDLEIPMILAAPPVILGTLLLLPFFAGEGEKHWSKRPVAILVVTLVAVTLGTFNYLGVHSPWSPQMDAWSAAAIPAKYVDQRSPLERRGALVFQEKQCRNCHAVGGVGGKRGPELDAVATRMTEDQMVRQVLQGGGNMPAYGKALSPDETTALVHYLRTLRGPGLMPAEDPSQGVLPVSGSHPVAQ